MLDSDWLIAVIFFLLFGSGNFSSLDWYFLQIPLPNMIYLYKIFNQSVVEVVIFLYLLSVIGIV